MQYVHEHTGVSNIANNAAYAAIVQIVNECTTEYKQYNKMRKRAVTLRMLNVRLRSLQKLKTLTN